MEAIAGIFILSMMAVWQIFLPKQALCATEVCGRSDYLWKNG